MKVLMTADTVGGVWSYAVELCSALQTSGVEIELATLGARLSSTQRAEISQLPHVRVHESDFRLEWMPDPWESLAAAAEWLIGLERSLAPDVVHLNHLVHGDLPWNAPVMVVGHSCVFSWWLAVRGGSPDSGWNLYRRRVKASLHAADEVVAPSRAMLSSLVQHYGAVPRMRVIPNARNPERYRTGRKYPMIFCAGRVWDEAKNVRALCNVAPSVAWPVFIAGACRGPGGQHEALQAVTQLGQLSSGVMAQWLASAAIYAGPARYEPFGLAPLEAALSGCALVLGDIPSLREVWSNAAIFVPPDSPDGLRDALNALISHPALLDRYSKRARARAARFNPRQFASSYLDLYEDMRASRETAQCASYSSITH